jgi:enhancing lycopene biosynthesis protein 2
MPKDMSEVRADDFAALVIPGGSGALKNLLNADRTHAREDVVRLISECRDAKKPVGAICIAPVVAAIALHEIGVSARLTIGDDAAYAAKIEALGHTHVECAAEGIVRDDENMIVSTPAYMRARDIAQVESGISGLIAAVVEMAG